MGIRSSAGYMAGIGSYRWREDVWANIGNFAHCDRRGLSSYSAGSERYLEGGGTLYWNFMHKG